MATRSWAVLAGVTTVLFGALVVGCGSDPQPTTPSQEKVQADSDRFFNEVREEERTHGKGSSVPDR